MDTAPSDSSLLMAFAASRDERAFNTLAKRYSGLIYQTALRALGDSMLAEDVSQCVLRALAAKAGRLARESAPLSSWLHRATILEAKAAYRAELRHRRRKEISMHQSATSNSDADADTAWRQAIPLLDRAINALPESDRRVLLLHYFDGLTFPQIAARLGKSAAAVQKQSRRALLALQRVLGRQGVTLSVGLLTTGLASEFAKAAPVLALPILPAAGKASLLAMNPATALAATLLLCSVPLVMQHHTLRELENSLAVSSPVPRSRAAAGNPATASISPIHRLISDLKAKDHDLPRYLRTLDSLDARSREESRDLVRLLLAGEMSAKDRNLGLTAVFNSLAEKDPQAALDLLLQEVPGAYIGKHPVIEQIVVGALGGWSHRDPVAAYRWFRAHTTDIRDFLSHARDPGYLEDNLRTFQIGQFLIFVSPADAIELFKEMPMHKRLEKLGALGLTPGDTFHTKLRKNPEPFIEVARNLVSEQDAAKLVANAAQAGFKGFPDQRILNSAAEFMDQRKLSTPEIEEIALRAGTEFLVTRAKQNSGEHPLAEEIATYRQWLHRRSVAGSDRIIGQALGRPILSNRFPAAGQAVLHHERHGLSEEAAIGFLETCPPDLDEALLREIADKLSDRVLAERLIRRVLPR